MSIEVGALVLGIEADYRRTLDNLSAVDRKAADTAARQEQNNNRVRTAINKQTDAIKTQERALDRLTNLRNSGKGTAEQLQRSEEAYKKATRARENADRAVRNAEIARQVEIRRAGERFVDQTVKHGRLKESIAEKERRVAERTTAAENQRNAQSQIAQRRYLASVQDAHAQALESDVRRTADANKRQNTDNAQYHMRRRREASQTASLEAQHIARVQRAERLAYQEDARLTRVATANAVRAQRQQAAAAARQQAAAARAARQQQRGLGVGLVGSALGISGAYAVGTGLRELVQMTNTYQRLQQRLAVVTKSQEHSNLIFREAGEVARNTRGSLEGTIELYTKLRVANDALQLSEAETMAVTEAFNNSLRASGATGQAAASAVLQFGQAMSKGKLDGDEFRTVAETNAVFMRIFAKDMGVTQGQLLKMREEGKLTAERAAQALIRNREELEKLANKMPLTMSQGLTAFQNSVLKTIGGSEDVKTAANNIAQAFVKTGETIEEHGPKVIAFFSLAGKILAMVTAINLLNRAVTALAAGGLARLAGMLGGPVGIALGLAVGADQYGKMKTAEARKADNDAIARIETLKQGLEHMDGLAKRLQERREQSAKTLGALQGMYGKDYAKKEGYQSIAATLKAEEDRLAGLINSTGRHMQAIKDFNNKTIQTTAQADDPDKKTKKEKDDTDEQIRNLLDLHEAELLSEAGLAKLTEMRDREQAIVNAGGDNYARLAEAMRRVNEIGAVLTPSMAGELEDFVPRIELLAENFGLLYDAMSPADVGEVLSRIREIGGSLDALASDDSNDALAERIKLLRELRDLQEQLVQTNPFHIEGATGEGGLDSFSQRVAEMNADIGSALDDILTRAPTDLFVSFFSGLGEQFVQGGDSLKDALLGTIGNIMVALGTALIPFGSMLSWMKKALLSLSGPMTIAVGAALITAGTALASRTMKKAVGGGGFSGGNIGSLGIGGEPDTTPRIYRFPDRTPAERSAGVEVSEGGTFVFAPTIIGERDPVAQRQLANMVDLARRKDVGRRF